MSNRSPIDSIYIEEGRITVNLWTGVRYIFEGGTESERLQGLREATGVQMTIMWYAEGEPVEPPKYRPEVVANALREVGPPDAPAFPSDELLMAFVRLHGTVSLTTVLGKWIDCDPGRVSDALSSLAQRGLITEYGGVAGETFWAMPPQAP